MNGINNEEKRKEIQRRKQTGVKKKKKTEQKSIPEYVVSEGGKTGQHEEMGGKTCDYEEMGERLRDRSDLTMKNLMGMINIRNCLYRQRRG